MSIPKLETYYNKLQKKYNLPPLPQTAPIIRLHGVIMAGTHPKNNQLLNLEILKKTIDVAFKYPRAQAVILKINCPGGAPAQTSELFQYILKVKSEHDLPVIAFVEDVAASGGYWLSLAADEIYADATSIIGSIGVISQGFGFHKLIQKIGIERRVYTSGQSKSLLDPFKPEQAEDVAKIRNVQNAIHERFIEIVKTRRGEKLDTNATLFDGQIWAGYQATELGLIDGVGNLHDIIKEKFGQDISLRVLNPGVASGLLRFLPSRRRVKQNIIHDGLNEVSAWLEIKHLWGQFGL